jgi:hypothetical protein
MRIAILCKVIVRISDCTIIMLELNTNDSTPEGHYITQERLFSSYLNIVLLLTEYQHVSGYQA